MLMIRLLAVVGILGNIAAGSSVFAQNAEPFSFKKGDHICSIGNTLADRMQHHGWLETLIQSRFPDHELVFRNLGFSADELTVRPRSDNFGSPDKHLAFSKADVIFAFFGYNESFNGEAGLPAFRKQLADFIDHTLSQKYNGKSAPRLVLFSPIAYEDTGNPNLPDGKENNARLKLYTQAMAEVAKEKKVPFVDLYHPTSAVYAQTKQPLTINGIHLTLEGNRRLAEIIEQALFGKTVPPGEETLETLRTAVLDKNLHWFNRYRVTDGYNVYGGRSKTGDYDGQTNATIMQREWEILDVKTANRDRKIWALARGSDYTVDDSNAPPPLTIKTNRPGPNPDGSHPFLSGKDAIAEMTVHTGMSINLFASEETFPEFINPVQASVDADGRLWVAAWPTYPHWNPRKEMNDKLLILPDDDGDGVADRCITFADHLHNPTGFEFWNGGVIVAQAPDLMFLKDTDGDDKADVRLRILHGIDSADTHHTANSFVIDPAGWLYFQRGVFHVTNVETPWQKPFRSNSTGLYRFNPRSFQIEYHFSVGPNPHGDVIDRWGNQFVSDGTSGTGYYVGFPRKPAPKQLYVKQYRPVPGTGLISGSHFPEKLQGNLLITNAIGFQGVAQYQFVDQGASFHCEPVEPIVFSKDPNFRPTAVEIGGDGALYITDWQNPLIGHLQHNLRDPNRDHRHGRIYRVTVNGRPLRKPVTMAGQPIAELLEHMKSDEDDIRYRARLELSGRESQAVADAAAKFAAGLDARDTKAAMPLTEALWLHQQHKIVNEALLRKVLTSPEPNARAAATKVLREWHPQIKNAGSLLIQLASDENPRVRAQAVVAATYYQGPDAAEVVFAAELLPQDLQITADLKEARSILNVDQYIRDAIADNKKLSKAAQLSMLKNASVNELVKLEPSEAVYLAILSRQNVPAEHLRYALGGLAKFQKSSDLDLLMKLIGDLDANEQAASLNGPTALLMERSPAELAGVKEALKKLATKGTTGEARKLGFAAWMTAAGAPGDAFASATQDKAGVKLWLESLSLLRDDKLRGQLYETVQPLLFSLPANLEQESGTSAIASSGIHVDFFQPNPRNVAVETLAQLKPQASGIVSDIRMDVPQLKTRDGFALRFTGLIHIDRGGRYTFFTRSDDGSRLYIGDELVVNNDGLHGMSEKKGSIQLSPGFHPITVTYFDNGGGDGLEVSWSGRGMRKGAIPAEKLSVSGGETLHDVAIGTLQSLPGPKAEMFRDLATLIKSGRNRTSAIRAIRQIPKEDWQKDQARPLVDNLTAYLTEIPARYRTGAVAMDALGLAKELAERLPADQARTAKERLENLDVRVIAIGTVPHRMIYDKERIVALAGQPVEFRFSNSDSMPHNFAITLPGAMEEIGLLAEATARDADAMARSYIPKSNKILMGSRLLQTGESQALSFEVPKQPGVYPYVCTYPGHWRRMYGALYVVENLADYQADPANYLAQHPLKIQDELLNLIGKSREWEVEELLESVKPLAEGRSYEVGYNAFKVASCIACHKMGSEGQQVGPELSKLDEKKTNAEHILRSLLTPSEKIEEKYQTYTFLLASGQTVTGMILEEKPEGIEIIENPLAKTKPLVIQKSDIELRKKSEKSLMPEGLVNKLTREEILDLIAYVVSKGDKNHKLFKGHEGHQH